MYILGCATEEHFDEHPFFHHYPPQIRVILFSSTVKMLAPPIPVDLTQIPVLALQYWKQARFQLHFPGCRAVTALICRIAVTVFRIR